MKLPRIFKTTIRHDREGNRYLVDDNVAVGLVIVVGGLLFLVLGILMLTDPLCSNRGKIANIYDLIPWGMALAGVAAVGVGARLSLTWLKITFDRNSRTVLLSRKCGKQSERKIYPRDSVRMTLHATVIKNPGGFDWHGFALTLIFGEQHIMIAREKDRNTLCQYGERLQKEIQIPLVAEPSSACDS